MNVLKEMNVVGTSILAVFCLFLFATSLQAAELETADFSEPMPEEVSSQPKSTRTIIPVLAEQSADGEYALPNFRILKDGDTDRNLKEIAINRVKKIRLTQSGRQTATKLIDDMNLYRRLPEIKFEIDPESYDYFVGHPDVVVGLWQSLGITAIGLKQVSKYQYQMDNTDGTHCQIFFLKRSKNANIVYCTGHFQSPLLKNPIEASGLVCIYTNFQTDSNGTTYAHHSADAFISFASSALGAAAKLASPVSNYIADRNFQEVSLFMHSLHLSMARQPSWVQGLANKLEPTMPERSRELDQLTMSIYKKNQARLAQQYDEYEEPITIR